MDGETLFLIQHERGIFEVEFAFVGPHRSLERFRGFGLRRGPRSLRVSITSGQHHSGQYRHKNLFHGRTPLSDNSSPTTRSSSMNASLTPAWRSSRRRLDVRLTRNESSSSSMPISPS